MTSHNNKSTPTCIVSDGVCYTDAQLISEKLNTYVCTIGNILAEKLRSVHSTIFTITIPSNDICNTEQFHFVPISVEKQLSCLQKSKVIGSDRISAHLLKDASSGIATCLAKLFNRSVTLASFPSSWKIGRITVLYKQGDLTDVNNYRPITILLVISKLLERAVYDQLYEYLLANKILAKEQFGFRAKRSTDAALLHITGKILASMDGRKVTRPVFLNLSKAFDTMDHELPLQKLLSSGLSDNTVTWFWSHLAIRLNATVIENERLSLMEVLVGPLPFLMYVNDLPQCLEFCNLMLYADDTVIYYSSSTIKDVESKLNTDLANTTNWFNSNLLTLNLEGPIFGGPRKLKLCGEVRLIVQGKQIKQSNTTKYLGIVIHENMTWGDHIRTVFSKVNRQIGILKQVCHILPKQELVTLYNSIVLPLMDYGDLVWGDNNNKTLMKYL